MLFNDYDWDIGDQSFQSSNAFGTGSDYMPPNPWDTPNSQPTNPSFEFGTFQLPSTVGDESAISISSAQGDTTPPTVPAEHFTFNIDDLPFVAPDLLHRI
ncbi:hypothetical protein FS749_014064 [Ceratobasidium sp. UAMH 11750]|nr:hypothetical protein FS749_014064 [Ceratobasidium sp. UAMH 11750]